MKEGFTCQHCGQCCGPIPVTGREWRAIQRMVARMSKWEQARVRFQGREAGTCPFRDIEKNRCSVYRARPVICRMQGEYEGLSCPYQTEFATGTRRQGRDRIGDIPEFVGIMGVDLGWDEVMRI